MTNQQKKKSLKLQNKALIPSKFYQNKLKGGAGYSMLDAQITYAIMRNIDVFKRLANR